MTKTLRRCGLALFVTMALAQHSTSPLAQTAYGTFGIDTAVNGPYTGPIVPPLPLVPDS